MKKYWKGIFGQVLATMKRFTRDKMALFFTFLFPLLFLFVFGSIFNNPSVNFNVVIVDNAKNDFSKGFIEGAKQDKGGALKVKEITTMDKAKEKLKHSQIEGIIELPKGFGEVTGEGDSAKPRGTLNVLYSKGSEQAGSTLSATSDCPGPQKLDQNLTIRMSGQRLQTLRLFLFSFWNLHFFLICFASK